MRLLYVSKCGELTTLHLVYRLHLILLAQHTPTSNQTIGIGSALWVMQEEGFDKHDEYVGKYVVRQV